LAAILDLPLSVDLIFFAIEKEKEKTAWDIWLSRYPYMTKENFVPFNEFKNQLYSPCKQYTQKPKEEIQEEMLQVVARHENRKQV